MDQQPGQQQAGVPPQWSADGHWWWDGQQWRARAEYRPPAPPGGRRPGRGPWLWIGLAGGLVVLMGVCTVAVANLGASGRTSVRPPAAPAVEQVTAAATTRPTAPPTPAPARDGSCSPQPCANDNYGWIVTVSDVKYDVPSGNDFEKPEAGNVYVTMNVSFTNKTSQEQHANPVTFVLLDGAGVKHEIGFMSACEPWEPVNLTPGASLGPKCLVFQATAAKPTGLTLVWTPSLIGGSYQMKLS